MSEPGRGDLFNDEALVTRALLRAALTTQPGTFWQALSPSQKQAAGATYFLLAGSSPAGVPPSAIRVQPFVQHTLARLLETLLRTTSRRRIELPGRVTGRIDWSATTRLRGRADFADYRYVCIEPHTQFARPENLLLKYLVVKIQDALALVPPPLTDGLLFDGLTGAWSGVSARLERLAFVLVTLRRNVHLRELPLVNDITAEHLRHAEVARNPGYRLAAQLYRRYRDTILRPSLAAITALESELVVLPRRLAPGSAEWIQLAALVLRRR